MSTPQEWQVRSRTIDEVVVAADQWDAWDTLRDRPIDEFGLLVTANRNGDDGNTIPVHTETLMRRWGRNDDADLCDLIARQHGLK